MPVDSTQPGGSAPRLSLVVMVYRMPEQAARTLYSLSTAYQQGVSDSDYEVIVMENSSDAPLGEEAVVRHGSQFRYYYREETSTSPVRSINYGFSLARAPFVGLMIDGARMVTPGLVRNILRASRIAERPIVAVPGYHLGEMLQQEAVDTGYDEKEEARLLERIGWPRDGYDLFTISCFSASCRGGFFRPFAESTCLCMPRTVLESLGGCDPGFDLPGGGNVNLDFYRRACEVPETQLIVLPGEGTFHQFHGGVTTNISKKSRAREALMKELNEQYQALRGEMYRSPQKQAALLGEVPPQAYPFLRYSLDRVAPSSAEPVSEVSAPEKESGQRGFLGRCWSFLRQRLP